MLQTLDLPCPQCVMAAARLEGNGLRRYSKTFVNRTADGYDPDEFVSRVNRWLGVQDRLAGISMSLHVDSQLMVRGLTITCQAGATTTETNVALARIPLGTVEAEGSAADVDEALNEWSAAHPNLTRVAHSEVRDAGFPTEIWVLYAEPALAGDPDD